MYRPFYSMRFEKSYLKLRRAGKIQREEIEIVVDIIAQGKKLSAEYEDHSLHGKFEGYRECHIRGDILLIYKIERKVLVLLVFDIGTHSQLFG